MPRNSGVIKTFELSFQGQVQGVGFRPFIYSLATSLSLKGHVSNDRKGVIIKLNATRDELDRFKRKVLSEPPVNARIEHQSVREVEHRDFDTFEIVPSLETDQLDLVLTSDFAICDECKLEINDPENRRYNYPFTTCVNCGPRYAITKYYPFEREHTSLSNFKMCAECQEEYSDPNDRRFHSQTNSCHACGPRIWLVDRLGNQVTQEPKDVVKSAVALLNSGKILAVKNINGYLLCCDSANSVAIKNLRARKHRPTKPLAVLYPSIDSIKNDFKLSDTETKELLSPVAPILIVNSQAYNGSMAINEIAPNLNQMGVMLPTSGLLYLLSNEFKSPLVATSGNIHGSPILSTKEEAEDSLNKVADYFLHHDLEIITPQDDSVTKVSGAAGKKVILRRSRGIAPNFWQKSDPGETSILASGAHLKSTIAYSPNSHIYLSQYLGNLDSYEVNTRLEQCINHYLKLFNRPPGTVLVDRHPNYQSTIVGKEIAARFNCQVSSIQHHKAHFASVLGEHSLFESDERILGVVWDGTGWGEDKNIWGGEFFVYSDQRMERVGHFDYFDWIAGDKMAREPRLSLLSILSEDARPGIQDKFESTEWKLYNQLLTSNRLKTSSVGRLFDSVASAIGLIDKTTYEGEAAMLLENNAQLVSGKLKINYLEGVEFDIVPTGHIVACVMQELEHGASPQQVARNFLYTLAQVIIYYAEKQAVNKIAVSGGVFQNTTLLDFLFELTQNKFNLITNVQLSPNDENIAMGQLFYFQKMEG